jgi:hypothetical protein
MVWIFYQNLQRNCLMVFAYIVAWHVLAGAFLCVDVY